MNQPLTQPSFKAAFISDTHISATRYENNRQSLIWVAKDAHERGAKYLFHSGDLYDRTAREEDFKCAAEWIEACKMPIYMIAGNHGTKRALEATQRFANANGDLPKIIYEPQILQTEDFRLFAIPHLDKANIHVVENITGIKHAQQTFSACIVDIFNWFAASSGHEREIHGPNIFLGHFAVNGARVSNGQELHDPGLSQGFIVPLKYITDLNMNFGALGHYHMTQLLTKDPFPVLYIGSHQRMNYGEQEDKGYYLVTFSKVNGAVLNIEFIKNPHTPVLITEEWRWNQADQEWEFEGEETEIANAEVRAVAIYNEGDKPDLVDLANTYKGQCKAYKIERRIQAVTKTRAIAVSQATTPEQKLLTYWEHINFQPSTETKTFVLAKLEDLFEETTHAYP